ncbi:hypothetical protein HYDPIDRAFT_111279 [Hydnomerulius pinastri MD-312]|uniref:DUF6534 domain-containing protein n=1 Tax=Hydnomerulius pinastri MD-312 TaxID=994086 RepID=A0A0C9WA30_9AGAM|nr:hypothetical protein HYDPIDRAFT_111279 [Hydnomerulius pinastri MD-312]
MSAVAFAGVNIGPYTGSTLAGIFGCLVLYGVSIMQTFIYYVWYPKDSCAQKLLVAILFVLDTAHAFLACSGIWNYFIQDYGDLANISLMHVPITLVILVTPLVSFIVQSYFIWRIWFLSAGRFKWMFPAVMMPCVTVPPALGFCFAAKLLTTPTVAELSSPLMIKLANASNGTAAAVDITITIAMCTLLAMGRTQFNANTDRMLLRLVVISINTGLWTALFALFAVILHVVYPGNLIFAGMCLPLCTLYCNTLVANFNVRSYARGHDQVYCLPTMPTSDSYRSDRQSWNPQPVHRCSSLAWAALTHVPQTKLGITVETSKVTDSESFPMKALADTHSRV